MSTVDRTKLPSGLHWGLSIEPPKYMRQTGAMLPDAKPKLIWHTTEGDGFAAMRRVLIAKGAQPHVLIDPGTRSVCQFIPFNQYARALEHPPDTPETNRAGCIQVEIVGHAAPQAGVRDVAEESLDWYMNLAALAVLIEHRTGIPRKAPKQFKQGVRRISPGLPFYRATGHYGHSMVPSQPSGHWDPGALNIRSLFQSMAVQEAHFNA